MPQSLSRLITHVVFSTKGRRPFISAEIRQTFHEYLAGTLRAIKCHPIQVGGIEDHVHLLFTLPRTMSNADVVEEVKSGSSRWAKGKWRDCSEFSWQRGYGAFSVGIRECEMIDRYIRNQAAHHSSEGFQDEYRRLLRENRIKFDERYVWD